LAANEQLPVPLVMVTWAVTARVSGGVAVAGVTAPTVQTPVPVMAGATAPRALVVAVTVKVELYAALAGAPVNVTAGVAMLTVSGPVA
jgi:hypothetical protein